MYRTPNYITLGNQKIHEDRHQEEQWKRLLRYVIQSYYLMINIIFHSILLWFFCFLFFLFFIFGINFFLLHHGIEQFINQRHFLVECLIFLVVFNNLAG